jgi:hypothetical protein
MTKNVPNTTALKACSKCKVAIDEPNSSLKYESLTPKLKNDESTSHYFEALDFAFSQADVKNIAVTGPYGAGKSTVIQSFVSLHKKIPHVNVSLAGFDIAGSDKTHDPREVELSILQQILYKVDRDVVPDSRIDRIQDRNDRHVFGLFSSLIKIVIPTLMLLGLIFTETAAQYFLLPAYLDDALKDRFILRSIAMILLFLLTLYYLTQSASRAGIFDKKLKLSKIAFLTGATEVQGQEPPSSLLNNCLDEIVYFFSRSKYRTVIFEDLDRLGKADIFIKLREINKIINNNRKVDDPVRFIYAVKDDIFLGADVRTKFFDYIVPIVPIMDTRNAYSILKSKITEFPDLQCLRGASLYITDMRSLQNIINEYNLYMNIVDNQSSKPKLFSLIFYKNLFALDYNLVDKKLGILYSYMQDFRTKKLHANHFANLDAQLDELEDKQNRAMHELKSNSADVREEILCRFISKKLWQHCFFYKAHANHYNNYSAQTTDGLVSSEEVFITYFTTADDIYLSHHSNQNKREVKLETHEVRNILDEYAVRVELTKDSRLNVIKQIQREIAELRENIRKRNEISLAELTKIMGRAEFNLLATNYIKDINDKGIISEEQEKTVLDSLKYGGFDALYYLITNGYLMQDFMMYRSIFYKGSISAEDNEYIKKVGLHINHTEANDSFLIENVADVTRELIANSYTHRDGALHHQVLADLLHNNPVVLDSVINSLLSRKCEDIYSIMGIIDQRFEDQNNFDRFIIAATKIAEHQDKLLRVLLEVDNGSLHTRIITSMMVHANLSQSLTLKEFRQYIEKCGWSLVSALELHQVVPFMNNAKSLGVIYDEVTEVISDTERAAAKFLADNDMYILNRETFYHIVMAKIGQEHISALDVENTPWSLLLDNNLTTIKNYVTSDIDSFVRNIFLLSNESSESIIAMLDNNDLDINLKVEIISHMAFSLEDHTQVTDSTVLKIDNSSMTLHDLLYKYDRIAPSWLALTKYVGSKCNRVVLRDYLTRHAEALSTDDNCQVPLETTADIYINIVSDDELSDEAYKRVTTLLHIPFTLLDDNISINNLRRLVENGKLPLEEDAYSHIIIEQKTTSDIVGFLLFWFEKYQNKFTENMDFYLLQNEDKEIFKQLFRASLQSTELSIELRSELVSHFINYPELSLLDGIDLPFTVLKNVIASSDSDPYKLALLTRYALNSRSTKANLLDLLGELEEKEVRKVLSQKVQATLQTSMPAEVLEFLSALKARCFINQYTDKGDGKIVVKIDSDFKTQLKW